MQFSQLVNKLSPTIKRIVFKLNIRYGNFDGDDLFQEALLHLWNDFNSGKLNDKTDSYILQGCYFHLKNFIRKEKPRSGIVSISSFGGGSEDDGQELLDIPDPRAINPREKAHADFLIEAIRNNGLTKTEKDALFLYADGFNTRESGSRLGVSHVAVVKALARARIKCLKHVDKI